jgi:hypothetical protein
VPTVHAAAGCMCMKASVLSEPGVRVRWSKVRLQCSHMCIRARVQAEADCH